ncbi:MAG TPA: hypothetical protein VK463_02730 [Desulfomonilaceae bacterium]|nr:hypothetical protein [Desulfomonilaceae bacterium]
MNQGRIIKTREIMSDVNSPMSNEDLMQKYGVTDTELMKLLDQVARALAGGLIYVEIPSGESRLPN